MIERRPSSPSVAEERRLASWSLHRVRLPYRRNVTWASHAASDAAYLVLQLRADDGTVGVGEIQVNPNWYGVTLQSLTVALEELFLPMLAKLERLDRAEFWLLARAIPENTSAKALIDYALWDLAAAAATGEPYWMVYGERRVPVSWMVTRQTPRLMADEAIEMAERYGFRTLKLKGGQGLELDLEVVHLVRRALGDAIMIYVDCNSYYDAKATPDYVAAMAAEGVLAVEDPCRLMPDRAFAQLQVESILPILVDAYCTNLRDAQLFCERGARAISLKLGRSGTSECLAMADLARSYGCAIHVGVSGESELGALAALSLAKQLTSPNGWLPAETTFFLMFEERVTFDPITIVDGYITLPNTVGLAQIIDWERVERFRT